MPFLNSHTVSLFAENQAFVALILSSLNIFAGQIDFYQNKNSAAKASLTSHSYNGKVRQVVDSRERVIASYRYDKDGGKFRVARIFL